MHRPTPLTLCGFLALFASFGCGSTSDTSNKPANTTPAVCDAPGYHVDAEPIQLPMVQAKVSLPTGEVAADLLMQVCGIDTCLRYFTDDKGVLAKVPPQKLERPSLKYGDGFDFAELAIPLDEQNANVGELIALPLPALAEGGAFPKSGAVTSGDVTLHIDANGQVAHDELTYSDPAELVLRSVAVPVADSPQALPPELGFELAYGLAPLGSTFCPAAKVSLKNTLNWPPGTEAEIFIQGLDVAEEWAPYGQWLQVAEARVSSDGKSIDTTSGGIPILSSIAVRRK